MELDSPGGQDKKECLEASQKTGLPIHGVVDSRHWTVRATESDPKRRQECETIVPLCNLVNSWSLQKNTERLHTAMTDNGR